MSTSVFADIGLPDPETQLSKAGIVRALSRIISAKGLTQAEAGALLGLSRSQVSALLDGQFRDYSVERLRRFISALDQNAAGGR